MKSDVGFGVLAFEEVVEMLAFGSLHLRLGALHFHLYYLLDIVVLLHFNRL